jgi:hypothetical protein
MNNKKKPKDMLSHKQFQILRHSHIDTWTTNEWLWEQGLNEGTFTNTHIKLLQAQQAAHALLTQHLSLLTATQTQTLKAFQQKMKQKKARAKLKPSHAYPILNISTKINRQLFKDYRRLDKQSIT